MKNNNNFDFIRFIAALSVIITHSYPMKGYLDYEDFLGQITLFPISYYAVRIFFLVSGYLILISFENRKSNFNYLWRRSLRIFPGIIAMSFVMVFIIGPIFTTKSISSYFFSSETYLFLNNIFLYRGYGMLNGVFQKNPTNTTINGSLWTLVYEFTFYWGLIILNIIGFLRFRYLTLIFWILATLISLPITPIFPYLESTSYIPFLRLNLLSFIEFASFFSLGMIFHQFKKEIIFNKKIFLFISIIYIGFIATGNYYFSKIGLFVLMPYIIFYLAMIKSKLNNFNKYGDFSYGIYIYAFPIQQIIVYLSNNTFSVTLITVITIFTVLPVSYLSWKLIEEPALSYKNKFY